MKNDIENGGSRHDQKEKVEAIVAGVAQSLESQGQAEENSILRHGQ